MAIMIPNKSDLCDFHGSFGERNIYDVLNELSDDYIVFHSVAWQKRNKTGYINWGEADFTIFNSKRGIIVIEVKSGGIKIENGKWKQINTLTGEEYNMKDPLIQANRSKYTFIELLSQNQSFNNNYRVEVAVAFPSLEKDKLPNILPPMYTSDIIITSDNLNNIEKTINDIYDYYGMEEKQYFSSFDKENCVSLLSPEFSVIPDLKQRITEEKFMFDRLTFEQSYLLDYLEEQYSAVIQGGAGTGKTILAIEKAIRLSKKDKVLFLCFNKFLLQHIKDLYAESNPNIDFFNLSTLSQQRTKIIDAWSNDNIFNYLNSYDKYGWEYKHIIIDEGQDFLPEQIELLEAIARTKGGCIYVFYDKNQLIHHHDKSTLSWVDLFDCRLVLFTNCRNTKSIATTSYRPIGIDEVKTKNLVLGIRPNFYISRSKEQCILNLSQVITRYIESGIYTKDIVILTLKTEETSILGAINYIGNYKLKYETNGKGILFTTARKYKGLESTVVIVVDVDDETFSSIEYCKVLYVATSRAKHFLDIVSILDDDQISNISYSMTGELRKNPKAIISSNLKVKIYDQ